MDEKKDKKEKIKIGNLDVVTRAVARLVRTEDGKIFINYLMRECGFARSSITVDTNSLEINTMSTIYNEARKTVYYKIRELIQQEDLIEIENLKIKEDDNDI